MTAAPSKKPRLGKKQRLLLRVERFSRKNYKLVFVLALLALVIGAWLGSRLELEPNVLALIPEGNRQVDTLKEALDDFGSIDYLLIMLEVEEERGVDDLEDFADLFADKLHDLEELVEYVEYRFELDSEFLELFYKNAILFLPPDRLSELAAMLSDEAILGRIQENLLALSTPAGALTHDLIANDPLGLMPLFLNRLEGSRGLLKFDLSDGYYLSEDGRSLIMLVKPVGPSQDLDFDRLLLEAVRESEAETREELLKDLDNEGAESVGVRVRYSGNYAIASDEAQLIRQDVKFNLFISLFAVSALYWLCYRRFAALLYSALPLMIGQALTFGLAFFVLGGLNASSSAFTALLMGLGTDFVIVVYARYVEERQKGLSLAQATEKMIGETGLGVFTGAITSAGTFYAMCISQFQGLRDLGFLIGGGILLCAVAILFMLPAMIKWNEGVRKRKIDAVQKLHLQSFFLEHLITFSARNRSLVIGIVAIVTLASGWAATHLEFDDTISALRSKRSKAYQVQQEISERFGASISYMMAIAEAPTLEEAVALTEKIQQRLGPFTESGIVSSYDSILTYLPPESEQQRVLHTLRNDDEGKFDHDRIRATFLRGLEESGFVKEKFSVVLERMDEFLRPEGPVGLEALRDQGLQRLLGRYISKKDDRVRIVTYIFLSDPRWKREAPPGLVEVITDYDEGIVVTGINVVAGEFSKIFTREAPRAVLLGLVVVFILLWVDFRSLKLTLIAMVQLSSGVIIMLGLMKLTGVHLNYVNAFVATMILGVGIDYSIHLVHRLSLSGGRVTAGLLETGKAVVMAALTNIAGFGTLTLGNYPALRSFGLVAVYGSIASLLTALTLVPAIMASGKEPE